jgi:hypothetical protein
MATTLLFASLVVILVVFLGLMRSLAEGLRWVVAVAVIPECART